jgi:hypothetical protein
VLSWNCDPRKAAVGCGKEVRKKVLVKAKSLSRHEGKRAIAMVGNEQQKNGPRHMKEWYGGKMTGVKDSENHPDIRHVRRPPSGSNPRLSALTSPDRRRLLSSVCCPLLTTTQSMWLNHPKGSTCLPKLEAPPPLDDRSARPRGTLLRSASHLWAAIRTFPILSLFPYPDTDTPYSTPSPPSHTGSTANTHAVTSTATVYSNGAWPRKPPAAVVR